MPVCGSEVAGPGVLNFVEVNPRGSPIFLLTESKDFDNLFYLPPWQQVPHGLASV